MINWTLLFGSLPDLLVCAGINIYIALCAVLIGSILGLCLALMEGSSSVLLKGAAIGYNTFFRGTPMIVQIMFVFYALPQLGVNMSPLTSVIAAIGLNSAAYLSQVLRSGFKSVPAKQMAAARSLGLSAQQAYRHVIIPQCLRNIFPALGNECITLLKDSSLASVVGIVEIVKMGAIIRGRTFEAFTVLLAVAIVYLFLTTLLSGGMKMVEAKMEKPCSL